MTQVESVRSLLAVLAGAGAREVCVAAGARNAPVITALQASGGVRLWSFFEERCAGFFALGRARATGRPVAVLTTSGTASAELLPAMIEAAYSGALLIAVTADRPPRFRGTGAPQSMEQPGLFGPHAACSIDAHPGEPVPALTSGQFPAHINFCLEEPLEVVREGIDFEASQWQAAREAKPDQFPADDSRWQLPPEFAAASCPAVLVSGLSPSHAHELAGGLAALKMPVFAEAVSNLWPLAGCDPALARRLRPATEKGLADFHADAVLRVGSVPTSRWWRDLESSGRTMVCNLSPLPFPGLGRTEGVHTAPWSERHRLLASLAEIGCRDEVSPISPGGAADSELEMVKALVDVMEEGGGGLLFAGNSLPVRHFNEAARPLRADLRFEASRGMNGIDGQISTWLGLCADSGPDAWLVVGDLTALYDLAAPAVLPQLAPRRRFLVILNNGGGGIFGRVKSLAALPAASRALIENRHQISFRPFAELWGMSHTVLSAPAEAAALLGKPSGAHVVECGLPGSG